MRVNFIVAVESLGTWEDMRNRNYDELDTVSISLLKGADRAFMYALRGAYCGPEGCRILRFD